MQIDGISSNWKPHHRLPRRKDAKGHKFCIVEHKRLTTASKQKAIYEDIFMLMIFSITTYNKTPQYLCVILALETGVQLRDAFTVTVFITAAL